MVAAAKVSKGPEKEKTYGHCRDNAIASIGKVVKVHGGPGVKPYLDIWLTMLPLRHDKPEAILQHELLVISYFILGGLSIETANLDFGKF